MKKNSSHNHMVIFSDEDVYYLDEMMYKPSVSQSSNSVSSQNNIFNLNSSNSNTSGSPNESNDSFKSSLGSPTTSSSSSHTNVLNLSSPPLSDYPLRNSSSNNLLNFYSTSPTTTHPKKPNQQWFEEEQNDNHHFDISFHPSGNRVFSAGEQVEVSLKVNVKKLQYLMATFECISTTNNHKTHTIEKNKLYSQDIHLYPTDKDLELKQQQQQQQHITTNTQNINQKIKIGNRRRTPSLKQETTIYSPTSPTSSLSSSSSTSSPLSSSGIKKSLSTGDYSSQRYDNDQQHLQQLQQQQQQQCSFLLEPLPEFKEDSIYQPPLIHSCSEHEIITNRKHRFVFRFQIPLNSVPSFTIQKDIKNGVFYRLFISGLGELHGSKFHNEGPMIKGIQTSVPMIIHSNDLSYLPKELLVLPPEKAISSSPQSLVTIKSRLIFKNYGIINSNITVHLSIDNQSSSVIKGFKFELINIQKSWLLNNNSNLENNVDNNNNNVDNIEKDKDKEKEKDKEKDDDQQQQQQQQTDVKICSNSSNIISSVRFKSLDKYIQPKSKYVNTISFSIPNNITPSIYLPNLLNTYILKISLRKLSNPFVELPFLILPCGPPTPF